MMTIDNDGYVKYQYPDSLKTIQKIFMLSRAEIVNSERPFYNRYLNSRKKKHRRN